MSEPAHDHDCEVCIYVGPDSPRDGERQVNQVDMYIHVSIRKIHSLIRRYSSEPSDYGCVDYNARDPNFWLPAKYQRVLNAWKEQNKWLGEHCMNP